MTRIEVNLSAEYGIMFLHDSMIAPTFPIEAGKEPIMHTPTCISFSVLSYVDGDAKIILADGSYESACLEYFAGEIECASKSLSLTDTNGFAFASVPLSDNFARISLRMSDKKYPDVVECVIQNLVTF